MAENEPNREPEEGMPDYRRMFADRVRDVSQPGTRPPADRPAAPRGGGPGRAGGWAIGIGIFLLVRLCAGFNFAPHHPTTYPPPPVKLPQQNDWQRPDAFNPPADGRRNVEPLDGIFRGGRERQKLDRGRPLPPPDGVDRLDPPEFGEALRRLQGGEPRPQAPGRPLAPDDL